jgi:hypothetical protein
MIVPIRC